MPTLCAPTTFLSMGKRDVNPFFVALQPSCLSHLPSIQAGDKLGGCSFSVPCHTSQLTPASSPSPGRLGPRQGARGQSGFRPTLVPTSPDLRSHPRLPGSNSPTLLSHYQGSPHCLLCSPKPGKRSSQLPFQKQISRHTAAQKPFLMALDRTSYKNIFLQLSHFT